MASGPAEPRRRRGVGDQWRRRRLPGISVALVVAGLVTAQAADGPGGAVVLPGLAGAAMLALGFHWLSDLLAGWAVGVMVLQLLPGDPPPPLHFGL
jgi:p-aminobenzoyl-glutamate transporter AbgT